MTFSTEEPWGWTDVITVGVAGAVPSAVGKGEVSEDEFVREERVGLRSRRCCCSVVFAISAPCTRSRTSRARRC